MPFISRIAPTPSGYLHLGNLYNFLLTFLATKLNNGKLHLRIDDYDPGRVRDEYLEEVFETLKWLSINWDYGPQNSSDFKKNFSCLHRMEKYHQALSQLSRSFVCECSRKTIEDNSQDGLYPGLCHDKELEFVPKKHSVRAHFSGRLGDFVLWTKEDLPSYQLASVVDDELLKVNFIIRGMDLKESSEAQKYLAEELKYQNFLEARILHHSLLKVDGQKISKSKGDTSIKELRTQGYQPEDVLKGFTDFFDFGIAINKRSDNGFGRV